MWNIEKIVNKGDYNWCVVRGHPKATKYGSYVYHHRIVMENYIGRILRTNEVVHHKNENKKDNRIENLELMDVREHSRIHRSTGKSMVTLKCPECSVIFDKERRLTFITKEKVKFTACSKSCSGKFSMKIYKLGITDEIKQLLTENFVKEYTLSTV